MHYARLGRTELRPSRLGMGCSRIASLSAASGAREACATVREALDRGVSLFDTADVYGQGDSERLLGRVLAGRRQEVIIASKAGLHTGWLEAPVRLLKPLLGPALRTSRRWRGRALERRRAAERQCFEPEWLRARVEGSLRRLRTDYLDIFFLHSPPPSVVERAEVRAVLEALQASGQIRFLGVSCDSVETARKALEWEAADVLQLPASLEDQRMLGSVLDRARGGDVGVVVREVFAGGRLLEGQYPDAEAPGPPDPGGEGVRGKVLLAARALHFVLARPGVATVLAGVSTRVHLRETLEALRIAEEWAEHGEPAIARTPAPPGPGGGGER